MPEPTDVGTVSVFEVLEQAYGCTETTLRLPEEQAGQAPEPPRAPGSTRFVEQRLVGRGGLGEVVQAFDLDLLRRVALKRTRPDRAGGDAVARLIEEAQVTAQLDHPNIPSVHALGIDREGRPFFAMDYIEGHSVADLIAARARDPELARAFGTSRLLRVFLQIGYAVAFAHARGVVHRDLKPANVLLGRFGEVRVLDWGLAKVLGQPERPPPAASQPAPEALGAEDETVLDPRVDGDRPPVQTSAAREETTAGAVLGTPGYMSPEQADGAADLDVRTDVYALGALLYAMLVGRAPVTGSTRLERIQRTVLGKLDPIPPEVDLPPALAAVIAKALATEREGRYPDVLALLHDVEAVLEDRPTSLEQDAGLLRRATQFYFARNERYARLRFMDIDLLALSSGMIGVAVGVWTAGWLAGPWPWLLLVAGIALHGIPTYTLLRARRPDDPGGLRAALEGAANDTSLPGSSSKEP